MKEEPIWPTGQWREALKAKDAEIERLKGENARLKQLNLMTDEQVVMDLKAEIDRLKAQGLRVTKLYEAAVETLVERDKLVTELCDALETRLPFARVGVEAIDAEFDLVHRAREATR